MTTIRPSQFDWPYEALHENVLYRVRDWGARNLRVVLATLIARTKSSPRPVGAQMAINEKGEFMGYLSGGCVERAIVDAALKRMNLDRPEIVSFGEGADNFDIRLSCGGRIDILLTPVEPRNQAIIRLAELLDLRLEASLIFRKSDASLAVKIGRFPALSSDYFVRRYTPRPRIVLAGSDPVILHILENARLNHIEPYLIRPFGPSYPPPMLKRAEYDDKDLSYALRNLNGDAYTGFYTLMHDDEQDNAFLEFALSVPSCCVGVLGSRSKIPQREKTLIDTGVAEKDVKRILSPAGLNFGHGNARFTACAIIAQFLSLLPEAKP